MSVTSLTTPHVQSICSRKNKSCPLFSSFNILFLPEVSHNAEVKMVANFRFRQTLKELLIFPLNLSHSTVLWVPQTHRNVCVPLLSPVGPLASSVSPVPRPGFSLQSHSASCCSGGESDPTTSTSIITF